MTYFDYFANGRQSEVKNARNILFYETGLANVSGLNTNTYVPGALADHLTSGGGNLFGTEQMSALRWLEAGVTASYGTVTEPCAHAEKFPAASVLVKSYFRGNTALEAYTKSVRQPSQGVFVGDPLARPFGTRATLVNGILSIKTSSLEPGINYNLYSAPSASGPFSQIATIAVPRYQFATITVAGMSAPFYKLESGDGTTLPSESAGGTAASAEENGRWIATARLIRNGAPSGSGVYLGSGLIVTAAHLVDPNSQISATVAGVTLPATILKHGSEE